MAQSGLPSDALGAIFASVDLRDRGACRLVSKSWQAAVDALTVRALVVRSPVLVTALPRFQLLQQLTLSASLTSSSSDFSRALALLPYLPHLSGLCLIFNSPAAVKLPASLQALTRLTRLGVHAQPRQVPLQGLSLTGLNLSGAHTDGSDGDLQASPGSSGAGGGGVVADLGGRALPPNLPHAPQHQQQQPQPPGPVLSGAAAAAAAFAAAAASFGRRRDSVSGGSGGGGIGRSGVASAAAVRVAPPGLIALLVSLPYLTSLELLHVAVSATDVLAAIRHAAATAAAGAAAPPDARCAQRVPAGSPAGRQTGPGAAGCCCSGGLRRLVLVGSGINVMGVGAPAAALQLAQLEVLTMDSCTGADELVPLLPLLTRLKHLSLSGMDYAWAASTGYTRRGGFNSTNNLHAQGGGGGGAGPGGLGGGGLARLLGGGDEEEEEGEELADLELLEAAAAAAAAAVGGGWAAADAEAEAGPGAQAAAPPVVAAAAAAPAAGPGAAMVIGIGGGGGAGGADGGVAGAAAGGEGDAGSRRRRLAAARRPLGFLQRLPRLCSLSLGGAFLRTLPSRELCHLSAVTALDLSGNGLDDLPYGLVSLPSLRRLDCSHNQLVALPGWVTAMQALTSLSVHHNSLERFPVLLYDMTALQHLAIGHNRISWWPVESLMPRTPPAGQHAHAHAAAAADAAPPPAEPGSPPQPQPQPHRGAASAAPPGSLLAGAPPQPSCFMTSLDMSHNRLFGLPGGLAAGALGRSLRCLRLRDSLSGLDGTGAARAMALLAGLRDLRELDLSSNHLDQHCIVPLSELRSLQRLWLSDNALEELPLGLAHLSDLRLLSLRANRFTDLPVCLRWMSSLEALDLSCNRLTELPAWLGGLHAPTPPPPLPHQQHHHDTDLLHAAAGPGPSGSGRHGSRPGTPGSCAAAAAATSPRCRCWPPEDRPHSGAQVASDSSHRLNKTTHELDTDTNTRTRTDSLSGGLRRSLDAGPPGAGDAMGEGERRWQPATGPGPQPQRGQQQPQHCEAGLQGLRWLDVSQQYAVVVKESGVPHIPPRLEVQPPHCLYGPLQGDLPQELLRLPRLRTLVLQRHPLFARSGVLRRLQARGVEVVHPRPLRIEALPGAAAAAFTTAAAAGGVLFPAAFHGRMMLPGMPGGVDAALRSAAAAAAARAGGGAAAAAGPQQVQASAAAAALAAMPRGLGPRMSLLLLGLVMLLPLCTAWLCSAVGLPPPPHVVMAVLVALAVRLALAALAMSRAAEARRQRQRAVAAAAAAAVPPMPGAGLAAAAPGVGLAGQQRYF